MDVDSYLKKAKPQGRRSSLTPYKKDLLKLRAHGCSLQQIVDFLAENGLKTTVGNVSKFLTKMTEESPGQNKGRRSTDARPAPSAEQEEAGHEQGPSAETIAPAADRVELANRNSIPGFGTPKFLRSQQGKTK